MSKRKWKSGANGCWWAVVSVQPDPMYPLPWAMGSTRVAAWRAWREWLGDDGDSARFKLVHVFITVAP